MNSGIQQQPKQFSWRTTQCVSVEAPRTWLPLDQAPMTPTSTVTHDKPELTAGSQSADWLTELYSLDAKKEERRAARLIFDQIDVLLDEGKFSRCDSLLSTVDPSRLGTTSLVALLSVTLPARDKLARRARLVELAVRQLERIAPERLERLMHGLR